MGGAPEMVSQSSPSTVMNTPTRPPLSAVRGASRETVAAEIERVRAEVLLLESRKEFDHAARCWLEFLGQYPDHPEAAHALGHVFVQMDRFEDGLRWFRRALEIRPDLLAAKTGAGIALRQLKRFEEAASTLHEVVAALPEDAEACLHLGLSLNALEHNEEAVTWLRRASALRPADVESARELGAVLTMLKRNDEAITAYERAISLQPDSIQVLMSLGDRLQEARRFEDAAASFRKVVHLDPNYCHAWLSLGAALLGIKQYAESLAAFRTALALEPGSVVGYCNMSLALMGLDRFEEAIEASRKALFIEAGSAVASFNLGCALLSVGNYREGWECYDYRFVMSGNKWLRPEAHAAPWTGEPLVGKSILVLGEQGNGDHIQFARYVSALARLGASVSFLAPERLHRLFGTLGPSITLIAEIPTDARFDFQCPLMSLPGRFDRLGLPIPTTPYLKAEPERVARWKERIGNEGFRVGIIWQGNHDPNGDTFRSFRLDALRPIAVLPDVRLVSLQLKEGKEQLEKLPEDMHVEELGPEFDAGPDGFVDSAAVMELMDLVISCDTSMAHLAGALGRPLWLALTQIPEWRWLRRRSDTVWYPTARLFRQDAANDWDQVFSRMTEELARLLDARVRATPARGSGLHRRALRVELSWSEVLERIAVMELRAARSAVEAADVRRELDAINAAVAEFGILSPKVEFHREQLRAIHARLREIDGAMRCCEPGPASEAGLAQLAREAQALNDRRDRIKQDIDHASS